MSFQTQVFSRAVFSSNVWGYGQFRLVFSIVVVVLLLSVVVVSISFLYFAVGQWLQTIVNDRKNNKREN